MNEFVNHLFGKNTIFLEVEKLLVDLFSNKLTGKLISRSEYQGIYEEAFLRYNIDEIKMFRYARRRNLEAEIKTFLRKIQVWY